MTVSDYLISWLQTAARPRVAERTFDSYKELVSRYAAGDFGACKLSALRPLHIQKCYSEMQERGLSTRTVRYLHAVLKSAFKQAVRWEMLSRNPAEVVNLPRQVRKEMCALSAGRSSRVSQGRRF